MVLGLFGLGFGPKVLGRLQPTGLIYIRKLARRILKRCVLLAPPQLWFGLEWAVSFTPKRCVLSSASSRSSVRVGSKRSVFCHLCRSSKQRKRWRRRAAQSRCSTMLWSWQWIPRLECSTTARSSSKKIES